MRPFEGFQRKAIVICPTDQDLRDRTVKRTDEEGKDVPDHAVLEMKGGTLGVGGFFWGRGGAFFFLVFSPVLANFTLPEAGEFLDAVLYVELQREEAEALVRQYNEEGRNAGPPPEKRFDGSGGRPPTFRGRGGGFQRFDGRGGNTATTTRGGFQNRGGSGAGFRGGGGGNGGTGTGRNPSPKSPPRSLPHFLCHPLPAFPPALFL